jgi:tRNA threonylcarbamoyladenosine biosynthesis protein TsaE
MWRRLAVLLIGLTALVAAASAGAHPHVWIDAKATVIFTKGKVTAIHMRWTFDPLFTAMVMGEHDKDKNKSFNKAEAVDIQKNAFSNLKNYSYFTHLRLNGKPAKVSRVRGFKPTFVKGKLVYDFTVLLDKPVDPLKTRFGFGVYDETYYIEIQFDEKTPVAKTGRGSAGCTYKIAVDKKHPFYSGIIFPRIATLRCVGS